MSMSSLSSSEDEYAESYDRRPRSFRISFGALNDVPRLQDALLHLEDLVPLAPRLLGIEVDAECRGEHRSREILGVVASLFGRLAVAVVLGEIAVALFVRRSSQADGGGDEAVGLVRVLPCHDAVDDLPRLDGLLALLPADLLAVRRKDRADRHEVGLLDASVAQGEVERGEAILVDAGAVSEENGLRHEQLVHRRVAVGTQGDDRPLLLLGHRSP